MRTVPSQIAARLPAAAELFADRGLDNTKIEDVAAATGIPKTLYYYFSGKEALRPDAEPDLRPGDCCMNG